jgi:N-acetylmuramoyl-L-alanine amidase
MIRRGQLLAWALLLLLFCAVARAGDWNVISYEGRDHVTMRNVAEFYGLQDYQQVDNTLLMGAPGRSLRGTIGSNELYINGLKFILSYPLSEVDGQPVVSRMDLTKVIEPVLRPSRIRNAAVIDSIVLDPGHGGYDNGAMSFWGCEKNYALDVALRAKPLLEAQGLSVYMTRTDDEFIPLEDRVRFANTHPTALFIAIHFNSGDMDANGIETYTLAPRGVPSMAATGPMLSDFMANPGNICDSENMALACATHASLISHIRLFDRGIKRARFVVIRDITIPGVLIEGGFLSNPGDARLIATAEYRQEEAQCIAIAVRNYRNAVNNQSSPGYHFEGSSVVVRDDIRPRSPPASEAPPPVGEAPSGDENPDTAPSPSPSAAPVAAETQPPPAPPAPAESKPAPPAQTQPPVQPSAQAENVSGSRSLVTPIVD